MEKLESLILDTLRFMLCSAEISSNIRSLNEESIKRYFDFKEKENSMSEEDFHNLYKKHKNDIDVLFMLSKSKNCPTYIIDQMLYEHPEELPTNVLRNIITRDDITETRLERICEEYQYDLDKIAYQCYRKDKITCTTKFMPEYVFSNMIVTTEKVHGFHDAMNLFAHSEDIDLIKKYMHKEYTNESDREYCLSIIASNNLLPDEIRNEAFDEGCSVEKLYDFTPHMVEGIYEQAMEAMDEIHRSNDPNSLWYARNMVYQVLGEIVRMNLMPEALQIDYVNRIKDENPKAMDDILTSILEDTTSQSVLQIAKTLKSKDSVRAYYNPNMDTKDVQNKAMEYCDKIIKAKQKKARWSEVWLDYLRSYIPRVQLKNEHYELLISMGKTRLNEAIATSPYTPISILEKLIECEKEKIKNANRDYIVRSSTKNISIANVNIACQKIKMDEKTIHNSIDFFLKCDHTFRTRVVPDVYERNMLNRYKESMGIEEFEKMKKAFVNAKDSLDEISQEKVSRLIYIENYLVEEKEKYDGKTYETMSTYELIREKENIYKSITQDAKNDMEVLYKNITEYLNNYNQINSLIDARAIAEKKEVGIDER